MPCPRSLVGRLCLSFSLLCAVSGLLNAAPRRENPDVWALSRDVEAMYSEEMQNAVVNLKWRGERLNDDTVYAVAVTGLSWQEAWGREHLATLAWGDKLKEPNRGKGRGRDRKATESAIAEILSYSRSRDYRSALARAEEIFTPEEISRDPRLKEAAGESLLALNQPDRAFAVFAAPFDPRPLVDPKRPKAQQQERVRAADRLFRARAWEAARASKQDREAVPFALSLLLNPGAEPPAVDVQVRGWLEGKGVDLDRVMLGILQSPERLKGVSTCWYAAADLLVTEAEPRLLPFFMHLAQSDDVYLRSRALLGLGVLGYRAVQFDPPGWASRVVQIGVREYGLSDMERRLIDREIREACESGSWRLRLAGALALGLTAPDGGRDRLEKLLKDSAYTLSPQGREKNATRTIAYPIRAAAVLGLARYGARPTAQTGGTFAGKALDSARRGGRDVTEDRGGLRDDAVCYVYVSPLDALTPSPVRSDG